ncbi:MAG TPA: PASTA domain-containing protein, partial [Actinobacteria bacterium]|nr:PASTA domain-containing protein [Actinomycetota bacterium]
MRQLPPDVVGFTLEEAASLLLDQGFDVRIEWIRVDNLATGTVFNMSPPAGSDAQIGTIVK